MAEPNIGGGDVSIPTKDELLNADGLDPKNTVATPQYTEIEQKAMEQGWKPKDQWEGDPETHRSAREYLDRGELLGKIKSQSQQIQEVRNALAGMTEHNKRVYAAGYENAIKELKAQKLQALRDNEPEAVMHLDEKIDEAKEALQTIKAQPKVAQGPSQTTVQWLQNNPWYSESKVMMAAANQIAADLARSTPGIDEETIYEVIDREIRKEFPHKFQKQATSAPSPDGEGRRSGGAGKPSQGSGSFEKLLGSMNETQASIARSLVKSGAITKEKYVEDWTKINGG